MLTRFHKILIGLLAVQVALIGLMFLRGGGAPQPVKETPLLAGFDTSKVTRVRLFASGAEKPGVDLVKKGAGWIVASHFDYTADPAKVTGLLEPLAKLAAGEPIATSESRHKQLRVADHDFDRKIVLDIEGSGEKAIIIGGPVGARRTAVRLAGDEVYAASEAPFFQAEPAGFVSTKYIDIPKAEIERLAIRRDPQLIEIARVTRTATPAPGAGSGSTGSAAAAAAGSAAAAEPPTADEGAGSAAAKPETWEVLIDGSPVKLAAGESLDTDAIDRIVGQATSIDLKAPGDPKRDASKPTAAITIHRKGHEQPTVLDVIADGERSYWIHQRDLERAIIVDRSAIGDVITVDRDKLVKKPPPPPTPAPGEGAGSGAGLPPGLKLPGPMPRLPGPMPRLPAPAPRLPAPPAPPPKR